MKIQYKLLRSLLGLVIFLVSTYNVSAQLPDSVYLMVHFIQPHSKQIHYAFSLDGYTWREINLGKRVFNAYDNSVHTRDPFMRAITKNGVTTYHMVHTGAGPTGPNEWDNPWIFHWQSTDLITWKAANGGTTAADGKINVMNGQNGNLSAVNAWAPEFEYDAATETYYIYWSSKLPSNEMHHYYCTTQDWITFTPSKLYFNAGMKAIDLTVLKHNGIYYGYYKDENNSRTVEATSTSLDPTVAAFSGSTRVFAAGTMSIDGTAGTVYNEKSEGPETFKAIGENKYFMFWDNLVSFRGFSFATTTDPATGWTFVPDNQITNPYPMRHGGVVNISKQHLLNILANFNDASPYAASSWIINTADKRQETNAWKYTTTAPANDWNQSPFNDTGWSNGTSGFGANMGSNANVKMGTTWNTSNIWMRRTFNPGNLTSLEKSRIQMRMMYDEDAEVYINGVLAYSVTGFTTSYWRYEISQAAKDAIIPNANNVIAVHCKQTGGGQYIDAGLQIVRDPATNLNGTYSLLTKNSAASANTKWMNVQGGSTADNAAIDIMAPSNSDVQRFEFTHLGHGVYKIVNKNSGKALTVNEGNRAVDTKLSQATYTGDLNQQFVVTPTSDGFYRITAVHSAKVLEVVGGSSTDGALVQQYLDNGQGACQWKLMGTKEIEIHQGSNTILPNRTYNFGNINLLSSSTDIQFTISNPGSETLSLTGTPKIVISGSNASDFTVTSDPSATVTAGSSTTFSLKFTPSSAGTRSAQITIANDDTDESSYVINLMGEGIKLAQSITFGSLTTKTFGDNPFDLAVTASSGLAVTYSSSNAAVATVSGNTITIVGGGTTTITASQTGDDTYSAATAVQQTLAVNKAIQTITFGPLAAKTFGDASFNLTATSSSSLAVTYSSSNTGVATVSGNTVTIIGGGTTTITASQAGNTNYLAATDVEQSFTVNKTTQSNTFGILPSKTYGEAAFDITATSSSGLNVTFASSNTAVATVSGNTVTIVGGGSTTITASQQGNNNYLAAPDVPQPLTIDKATQTISFADLPDRHFKASNFMVEASSSSGLPVTYNVVSGPATISGNTVTLDGNLGVVELKASQAGNDNYLAATEVTKTFTVICAPEPPTVTSGLHCGPGTVTLSASGTTDG
jgi:hypothetical protein